MDVQGAAHWLPSSPTWMPSGSGSTAGPTAGSHRARAGAGLRSLRGRVDIHGVHDRTAGIADRFAGAQVRPEKPADLDQAIQVMWESSPVADMATWRSPVL